MTKIEWQFWSKVNILEDDECWLWQGALLRNGYGYAVFDNRNQGAHRIAYQLHFQIKLNDRLQLVCHTCDNRPCCNPNHLFLSNHKGNFADMIAKGRSLTGSRNHQTKLKEQDVLTIRKLSTTGMMQKDIAQRFRVTQSRISAIVTRHSWKQI